MLGRCVSAVDELRTVGAVAELAPFQAAGTGMYLSQSALGRRTTISKARWARDASCPDNPVCHAHRPRLFVRVWHAMLAGSHFRRALGAGGASHSHCGPKPCRSIGRVSDAHSTGVCLSERNLLPGRRSGSQRASMAHARFPRTTRIRRISIPVDTRHAERSPGSRAGRDWRREQREPDGGSPDSRANRP